MRKSRSIMLSAGTVILIIATMLIYDAHRPACVGAQCFTPFTQIQSQSCQASCSYCGGSSCSMTNRANQACFLSAFEIGDLGGGSDRAGCGSFSAGASASTSSDGIANCTATCVNFL
jgi:hypothetical protein